MLTRWMLHIECEIRPVLVAFAVGPLMEAVVVDGRQSFVVAWVAHIAVVTKEVASADVKRSMFVEVFSVEQF
jgi:hypothetical protein